MQPAAAVRRKTAERCPDPHRQSADGTLPRGATASGWGRPRNDPRRRGGLGRAAPALLLGAVLIAVVARLSDPRRPPLGSPTQSSSPRVLRDLDRTDRAPPPPPPPPSRLQKSEPDCTIDRRPLSHPGVASALDYSRPVLLTGWEGRPTGWDRASFLAKYGGFVQYIKGGDVRPPRDGGGEPCVAPGSELFRIMEANRDRGGGSGGGKKLLFFTNDVENKVFLDALAPSYGAPDVLSAVDGFRVLSLMTTGSSHPFHKHDAAWIGQVEGSKAWWFLPPSSHRPEKVDGCRYLSEVTPPEGTTACVQRPGDVIYVPPSWYHATCALEDFTVAVGAQNGSPNVYEQGFDKLDRLNDNADKDLRLSGEGLAKKMAKCGAIGGGGDALGAAVAAAAEPSTEMVPTLGRKVQVQAEATTAKEPPTETGAALVQKIQAETKAKAGVRKTVSGVGSEWDFFGGDLNAYYNKLEDDHTGVRDPKSVQSIAVHRWLGRDMSTSEHYELLRSAIRRHRGGGGGAEGEGASPSPLVRVLDAGCGLGAGLLWFERHEPRWELVGRTISERQHDFIRRELPHHKFEVELKSYDYLDGTYDAIYSIEALIHSPDLKNTLQVWSSHLNEGGVVAIIDDFIAAGADKENDEVQLFAKSWLANALVSTLEFARIASKVGLTVVEDRDLVTEYDIININYGGKMPKLTPEMRRTHQGWLGSKMRQRLTVKGVVTYRMLVLRKGGKGRGAAKLREARCAAVPKKEGKRSAGVEFKRILPEHRTGVGKDGGKKQMCISGWYCCGKGEEMWDDLEKSRTDRTAFLSLDRDLFGHYMDSFAGRLNEFYDTLPAGATGKFLDIGGTGSVASGMQQVTSKFQHFAGPLEYWVLDSDPKAKGLDRALACDIADCPDAPDCGFDVTFSHTVLEHSPRPWEAFDTIARITKKGGLTLHLVPFSYQYHATPEDHYRFSHSALRSLLENRGFTVLEVGYDICTQPEGVRKKRRDEHYEVIWLTYVIGRKD